MVAICKIEMVRKLIQQLRVFFGVYGVPQELATDSALVYMAKETVEFLRTWGVKQRVSSAYFPHSNLQEENGVRSISAFLD